MSASTHEFVALTMGLFLFKTANLSAPSRGEVTYYVPEGQEEVGVTTGFFKLSPLHYLSDHVGWRISAPAVHVLPGKSYVVATRRSFRPLPLGVPVSDLLNPRIAFMQKDIIVYEVPDKAAVVMSTKVDEMRI